MEADKGQAIAMRHAKGYKAYANQDSLKYHKIPSASLIDGILCCDLCTYPVVNGKTKTMRTTNNEIAVRIDEYLKRFERDPKINIVKPGRTGTTFQKYYEAGAWASGKFIYIRYKIYQGAVPLTRAKAERYLAWLDAGNVGKHVELI
jgi:hypothetical protein